MNVLLQDDRAVGRLDEDGSVWSADDGSGYAERVGRVDSDGTVYGVTNEACLGSVDSAGLIWATGGRLIGTMDAKSNAVYQDGHLVGHVFGPDPCRAAAALVLLVPESAGEPDDEDEEAAQESSRSVRESPPLAIVPPARNSRGVYFVAHLALVAVVLGGLGWGGFALFAAASHAMREARIGASLPSTFIQPTGTQAASTNTIASVQPTPVAGDEVRALLEARYRRMDAGYRTRDESTFAYFAPEWKYVRSDGSASDLSEARRYFALRSSGPKRFTDCSMEQQISKLSINGETAVAVVDQDVYTETRRQDGSPRRVRTLVRQEDTWRDDGGASGWRCVRSRLLSQKSTRL